MGALAGIEMQRQGALLIERLQVEEGFLDGLDLQFTPGLNVLLGSRGAGKTSIIELIRMCLGVPGFTKRSSAQAREHALSILDSGQVTLTYRIGEQSYAISRTADDDISPAPVWPMPMVLSHNEIENIGLHAPGRLGLIDSFVIADEEWRTKEVHLCTEVRSLSAQVHSAANEVRAIDDQLEDLSSVDGELKESMTAQEGQLRSIQATEQQRVELDQLNSQGAILGVKNSAYQRGHALMESWHARIVAASDGPPELERIEGDGSHAIESARLNVERGIRLLHEAQEAASQARENVAQAWRESHEQRGTVDNRARELRQHLETLKEGAGALARTVSTLQEKAGQRQALLALRESKQAVLQRARQSRREALTRLDNLRTERFRARATIAEGLNDQLRPAIEVQLVRLSEYQDYENAIVSMLRGSGLQFNAIASTLARTLAPIELAVAIEDSLSDMIAEYAQISTQRAERLIAHARIVGADAILSTSIEDGVQLRLLVGSEYRDSESLSTGQRCTVVLPIILGADQRVVVIDQPEDHLDNAFIASTVIRSLTGRRAGSQIICATHNANIPVLGEASRVVVLDSDGKRGFVRHSGALDDPQSAEAITTIMEGGAEAFERRASFYRSRNRR